jgi:hypothetical protein
MAVNSVSAQQASRLSEVYAATLQGKPEKADTQQEQAKLASTRAESVKAERAAEDRKRVEAQADAAPPPTTNLDGQSLGKLLSVVA